MSDKSEGLRQRKRRDTTQRIVAEAMRLFVAQGFEATSLDAVAAAAGISRRTFFNYFTSKDDILISLQAGLCEVIVEGVAAAPQGMRPLEAVGFAFQRLAGQIPADEMLAIDRMMRSNAAVQAAKQASYAAHEQKLLAALRIRWPEPEQATALRLVAMVSIGALRLSLETWAREGGGCSFASLLQDAIATLRGGV